MMNLYYSAKMENSQSCPSDLTIHQTIVNNKEVSHRCVTYSEMGNLCKIYQIRMKSQIL